jgi:hypothetical protein
MFIILGKKKKLSDNMIRYMEGVNIKLRIIKLFEGLPSVLRV